MAEQGKVSIERRNAIGVKVGEASEHKATVRSIDADYGVGPCYLLEIKVGKYDDGTTKTQQWLMQGAVVRITESGVRIEGFASCILNPEATDDTFERMIWWVNR